MSRSGSEYRSRTIEMLREEQESLMLLYQHHPDPDSDSDLDVDVDYDDGIEDLIHRTMHQHENDYTMEQQLERAVRVHPELLEILRADLAGETDLSDSNSDEQEDGDDFLYRCQALRNSLLRWR